MAPRNALYHGYLLRRMRAEALDGAAGITGAERRAVLAARNIYQFDDAFVAPRGGFAGAEDYYAQCSAETFLAAVETPTLVIHARDDPWVPAAPYRRFPWRSKPNLVPLLPPAGGHVGFHGTGSRTAWHDRCMVRFFGEVLG